MDARTVIAAIDLVPGDLLYTSQGYRRIVDLRIDNRVTLATDKGTIYLALTDTVEIPA